MKSDPKDRTYVCSVVFLDIVKFSQQSNSVQSAWRVELSKMLEMGLKGMDPSQRIIIDTGDGAAIAFLVDLEDALTFLRYVFEALTQLHNFSLRIGAHLGPLRVVQGLNGQPTIAGDGINAAQRVMGFSGVNEVLVSRAFQEAVIGLAPDNSGLFSPYGKQHDKHGREHDLCRMGPSPQALTPPPSQTTGLSGRLALVAFLIALVGFGIWFAQTKQDPAPSLSATASARPHYDDLFVVVVKSEGVPYEKVIADSFLHGLREGLGGKKLRHEEYVGTFARPGSPEGKAGWDKVTGDIYSRFKDSKVDYLVGVGTFGTRAIMDAGLVQKLGARGVIFLGVTDPEKSGFVTTASDTRTENTEITGVRYGTGGRAYGAAIASLFPKQQKLVFVYDTNTPQDRFVAGDLESLNKMEHRFEIRGANRPVSPADLKRPGEVYFAWYGLDNTLNSPGGAEVLKATRVIPSTYSKENVDYAGIVVSVFDEDVGTFGADLVLKLHADKKLKLGHEKVVSPPFHTWINCDTIHAKGIALVPDFADASLPNRTLIGKCRQPIAD